MFDSYGHAISTMQIIFFDSSSNVGWGHLVVFVVFIRCSLSQSSLYPFLWITLLFVQFSFHHFVSGGSTSLLITHRTTNTFSALLCCRTYSVLANFLQPTRRCCTVSFCFHIILFSLSPHIFFHAIVSTNCSCMLNTAAVLAGSVLHFSHP